MDDNPHILTINVRLRLEKYNLGLKALTQHINNREIRDAI